MLYLTILVSGAIISDLIEDKIYNIWVVPGMLFGMALVGIQGVGMLFNTLMMQLFILALLVPLYIIRGLGAGDIKLFMAIAPYLSRQDTLSCIINSFIIGGIISILCMIIKHRKIKTIHFALPIGISILLNYLGINISTLF
ncbi:MAG: prepilin peptidase [Butyrivibrio sp.]|nr:prepilin peptidase [Butyrivibrio sp.]